MHFHRLILASAITLSTSALAQRYKPTLPTSWAPAVTNKFFPLVPGTTTEFRAATSAGIETVRVEVLAEKRVIMGVSATVVRDREFLGGVLKEDTYDWFAQDAAGNVWYLGEDTKEIENGHAASTEGSWEWGKDGALPGIQMWADPAVHVGTAYRQEYRRGKAEDWGKVITLNVGITVPLGAYTGCVTTEDWSGIEHSEAHEHKTYCPGSGVVREGLIGAKAGASELVSRKQ